MSDGSPRTSDDSLLVRVAHAPPREPVALPRPGTRLGRFQLDRRLGQGAMGVVFAARDEILGRDVALKILVREASAHARARLLSEARAAARIDHPAVARVQDALEIDGYLVLVMELVLGSTLRAVIADAGGGLPVARAAHLVADAADGVHAAHLAGVTHHDLKPDNVMITGAGRVKVLDFGLASILGEGARPGGRFAGTARYAAPEAESGDASAASDQFALAVMFLEAAGVRRTDALESDALPARLRRVTLRALAARPEHRFEDCARFAAALRAAVAPTHDAALGVAAALTLTGTLLATSGGHYDNIVSNLSTTTSHVPLPAEVACPPLRCDEGWLGAAAADLACRRARMHLGGGSTRALPPASLLGLPALPSPTFPRDPYADPSQRERARERAITTGRIVIDGQVEPREAGFSVSLSASFSGEVLARGRGEGDLAASTAAAVDALFANPALTTRPPDPEVARWSGVETHEELERLDSAEAALTTGAGLGRALARLDSAPARSPLETLLAARLSAGLGLARAVTPPAADTSSPAALARTAPFHLLLGGRGGSDLVARTHAARLAERSDAGRFHLLVAEATSSLALGDRDRARILGLAAARERPFDAPWSVLAAATYGRPEMATVARAYAAWRPETADAWNILAHVDTPEAERVAMLERAHRLSDAFPLFAGNYGTWLLLAGRSDEAAGVAARLEVGSLGQRVAAARLRAEIVLADGRIRDAYETAWKGLEALDSVGSIESGDVALLGLFVELGALLGEGEVTAREVVSTFVMADPPRLDHGPLARAAIAHACAYAEASIARRCFTRLDELERAGFFPLGAVADTSAYVEGARAFSQGELEAAAAAFRRVKSDMSVRAAVAAIALEHAGDLDAADAADPPRPGIFGGVSGSFARNARRAEKRGDCDRAIRLASKLIDGWRRADTRLALVDEMERLVRRCGADRRPLVR